MNTTTIAFAANEQHMLYGLMAFMYAQGQKLPDQGKAWVIIGRKIRATEGAEYSDDEIDLLKLAVQATLSAGERALERLPEENVAARIKGGLVKTTYLAIQEKINNGKRTEVESGEDAQNLRGDNEGRQDPQGDNFHGTAGRSSPPTSGAGSSEGT
jgi:hypothetical protein